ncbi:MAG: CvpA family protein [Clostridia bacterium]|nr:CvpA family protein [Clostridia bacterium]
MRKAKPHIWASIVVLLTAGIGYYFLLPAINIHNQDLLTYIAVLAIIYRFVLLLFNRNTIKVEILGEKRNVWKNRSTATKVVVCIVGVCALVGIIGSLSGAVIFRAKDYRELLEVKEGDFVKDVEEISYDQIPTLDYDSATKLGDRKMGELSDMVSQFTVLDDYTQINYQGVPTRVTPLGYVDVIKWMTNMKDGIPAYISIDMVSQEVTVHRLSEGMKYTRSDHFGRNIYRHLRFNYPTYIFEEPDFEIDENGTPWWVCSRIGYKIGLYGGRDIVGTVLVNAVTGEHVYYDIKDVPAWVDRAYNAEMIIEQYDYYGTLQRGYWNSVLGQKDCKQTTDGYNYIAIDDDVYMYTGITSLAADESNVGFILANQRTKETTFYSVGGAEEYSAMASAEGEVQNLRYGATFPLLLNISGEPTYFVALKDGAGLVKMYAFVNVRQYQIVGKGETLKACEADYLEKLSNNDVIVPEEDTRETLTLTAAVTDIRSAVVEGNTHLYFVLEGNENIFVVSVADFEEAITYNVGDTLTITYKETDSPLIYAESIEK